MVHKAYRIAPPRITLNEDVSPVSKIGQDGHEPDTTRSNLSLEGVTSHPTLKNNIPSVQNNKVAPPDTAMDVGSVKQKISHKSHPITPVTPVSTALKGVTPSSPALQFTEEVTMTTKYSDQLTPASPVLGGVTLKTLTE